MSSPETFLAFGAIMLIIALIGVAIDWFGKPLRHRKFIPKAYKFPDERLFRSDVFNPAGETGIQTRNDYSPDSGSKDLIALAEPDVNTSSIEAVVGISESSETSVNEPVALNGNGDVKDRDSDVTLSIKTKSDQSNETKELESPIVGIRLRGWSPGDDIYNLTKNGSEPTPSTVRSRFWKNVGVSSGATIFGATNVERLRDGKPPQRRNPRTSKYETMKVHLLSYEDGQGRTPIPNWPNSSVDPFGDRN